MSLRKRVAELEKAERKNEQLRHDLEFLTYKSGCPRYEPAKAVFREIVNELIDKAIISKTQVTVPVVNEEGQQLTTYRQYIGLINRTKDYSIQDFLKLLEKALDVKIQVVASQEKFEVVDVEDSEEKEE